MLPQNLYQEEIVIRISSRTNFNEMKNKRPAILWGKSLT